MVSFKPGDVVRTRDGRKEEVLKVDAPYPHPLISMDVLTGLVTRRYADGRIFHDRDHSTDDLLPPEAAADKPKRTREVTWYFNIYEKYEEPFVCEEHAKAVARPYALAIAVPATFKVEVVR